MVIGGWGSGGGERGEEKNGQFFHSGILLSKLSRKRSSSGFEKLFFSILTGKKKKYRQVVGMSCTVAEVWLLIWKEKKKQSQTFPDQVRLHARNGNWGMTNIFILASLVYRNVCSIAKCFLTYIRDCLIVSHTGESDFIVMHIERIFAEDFCYVSVTEVGTCGTGCGTRCCSISTASETLAPRNRRTADVKQHLKLVSRACQNSMWSYLFNKK